jgi:hypothetical protein
MKQKPVQALAVPFRVNPAKNFRNEKLEPMQEIEISVIVLWQLGQDVRTHAPIAKQRPQCFGSLCFCSGH